VNGVFSGNRNGRFGIIRTAFVGAFRTNGFSNTVMDGILSSDLEMDRMYTRKDIPFDPVTLSFRDKELEADFRDDFFTRNLSHFRQDLLLGCFLYAVYGILDFWIIPEIRLATWNIRFALVCPLLLGVFLFTFSRLSRRFLEPALILACFAAGAGIIAMIVLASPPGSHLYYAGLLLCLLF